MIALIVPKAGLVPASWNGTKILLIIEPRALNGVANNLAIECQISGRAVLVLVLAHDCEFELPSAANADCREHDKDGQKPKGFGLNKHGIEET